MTPTYLPDPGRIFRSDVHRRVAAHLPAPDEDPTNLEDLLIRVDADADTPFGVDEGDEEGLREVVLSLCGDDLAEAPAKEVYRLTVLGLEKLTGPIAAEPPPLEGARLAAAEALDAELATQEDADVKQAKETAVTNLKAELKAAEKSLAEDA